MEDCKKYELDRNELNQGDVLHKLSKMCFAKQKNDSKRDFSYRVLGFLFLSKNLNVIVICLTACPCHEHMLKHFPCFLLLRSFPVVHKWKRL